MEPARAVQPFCLFKCKPSLLQNLISLSIVSTTMRSLLDIPELMPILRRSLKHDIFESTDAKSFLGGTLHTNILPLYSSLIFSIDLVNSSNRVSGVTVFFLRSFVPASSTKTSTLAPFLFRYSIARWQVPVTVSPIWPILQP